MQLGPTLERRRLEMLWPASWSRAYTKGDRGARDPERLRRFRYCLAGGDEGMRRPGESYSDVILRLIEIAKGRR